MDIRLLELCGLEPDEIRRESGRINRALECWEIGDHDVKRGEERVERFFDLELTGIRKFLGIWLKEFTDLTLAKEEGKKVVYAAFPPVPEMALATALVASDVYCAIPELVISVVVGQIFGKLGPIFREAEKFWLPPGQAHCSLLKIRLGAILKGLIPKPDLLMPSGVTCDQVPKTDEIVEQLYGVPVAHLDSCPDEDGAQWPDVMPVRVQYFAQEMKNAAQLLQRVTGYDFTAETIEKGMIEHNELLPIHNQIVELLRSEPMPISLKDISLAGYGYSSCARRFTKEGSDAGNTLLKELKERVDQGIGVVGKGTPRVMVYQAHISDPAMNEVIEKLGLAAIQLIQAGRRSNIPSKYASVWEKAAEKNMRIGTRYCALASIGEVKAVCQDWELDGAIIDPACNCRIPQIFSLKAKEVVEKELGIPVMVLEQDSWDSRIYTAERFERIVEPFAQIVKERKKASATK